MGNKIYNFLKSDVAEPMETGDENLDMAEINAIESILR